MITITNRTKKFVYALELNSGKDLDHPFVKNVRRLTNFQDRWINIVFSLLPAKMVEYFDFQFIDVKAMEYLANVTRAIIKQRTEGENRESYNDFIDLLINTIREKNLKVSDDEIISNCVVSHLFRSFKTCIIILIL